MTKEKTDALYAKYPEIFKEHELPMKETCRCWGFECGDGWFGIIDALCDRLTCIEKETNVQTVATQVKEKFGTLRFYFNLETSLNKGVNGLEKINEQIHELVDSFELFSGYVCEQCGTTLNVTARSRHGWISTQCDACFAKSGPEEDKPDEP